MVTVKRAAAMLVLVFVLTLITAAPAHAQARDPFRPPAGAEPVPGGEAPAPGDDEGVVLPPTPGGLPRTGQDLVMLVAAGLVLICAGSALRLTGRLSPI